MEQYPNFVFQNFMWKMFVTLNAFLHTKFHTVMKFPGSLEVGNVREGYFVRHSFIHKNMSFYYIWTLGMQK